MKLPQIPSLRLDGRSALVTGASQGIGLACACALAQANARVTLVARNSERLEEVVAALRAAGHEAEALVLDIHNHAATCSTLEGRGFDILVNNAGTNRPKPIEQVTEEDYAAVMELNVRAAYFLTQTVVKEMSEGGSVINISSQMGHVGARNRSLYCASKAAVEGMTRAMAVELGPRGIRVNSLCPTFIETPMTQPFFQEPGFR